MAATYSDKPQHAVFGSSDALGTFTVLPAERRVEVFQLRVGNRIVTAQVRLPAGLKLAAGDPVDVTLDGRVLNLVLSNGDEVSALIKRTRFL